jgi:hypothetical protein
VHTGLAVITGTEDRQHTYVALTRGTDTNTAYVFTLPAKLADPAPGPRPAPELARYDKLTIGQAAGPDPATPDALAVLADVLEQDGQQLSASQTWQQALADADHLAILHAIWTAETAPAREQHYKELLMSSLPPQYQQEPSHQAKWLWRTLRAAELAGLDAGQVLADAVAERDLAGARDVPSVLDARLRHRTGALVPRSAGPWAAQLPDIADPERRAYAAHIAVMMDVRKDRIGEHAAEHALPWAVGALGPVPDDPVDRLDWQHQASSIGAYRELSGHDHPADPIGPDPVTVAPDLRAAWHEALTALGPVDGPDVRGMPDGTLLHLRDTYPVETAWAPQWVGSELRQVRLGAAEARLAAIRAAAEAGTARRQGQDDKASQQQVLADSYQAMHDTYREREAEFAAVTADRADWEQVTRSQRQLAVAADAELRRRHPEQQHPPLRSAEPKPATQEQRAELALTVGEEIPRLGQWIKDLAGQRREFADRLAERQSLMTPAENPDYEDLGPAFPARTGTARDAILQPPKPQIQPSLRILERVTGRNLDLEAAE